MDILIKNVELPKACYSDVYSEQGNCPFHFVAYQGGSHCSISECKCLKTKRPKECPLVELPPHGDLKDTNKILQWLNRICDEGQSISVGEIIDYIENAPTVLEATEGENK